MNGYGSHTYLWINASGEKFWVKFHFHSDQGVENWSGRRRREDRRRGRRLPPTRPVRGDRARGSTRAGRCACRSCRTTRRRPTTINPFDLTKVWPHADYPLIEVGTDDAEGEPGELLRADRPGLRSRRATSCRASASRPDRMLLARVFAYADAHRARVGVNHDQLPVNRPHRRGETRLHLRRADAVRAQRRRQATYAANSTAARTPTTTGRRGRLGGRRRDDPVRADPARGRRRLRPGRARSCARSSTTPPATASWRPSPARCCRTSAPPVLERAFWYWSQVDARSAPGSRPRSSGAGRRRPGQRPRQGQGKEKQPAT
jgi:catalase